MLEPIITQASKYTEHESFQSQQSSTAPIPGAETSQAKHYSADLPDSFETQPSVSALVVKSVTSLDPLTTFSQMDEKNSEGEAKIRSLLAPCRAESFDDETAEAELEASVEDLSKAISNAICCGTFNYEKLSRRVAVCKGQTTGKPQRMGCENWGKELEKLPHKEYNYSVPCGVPYERVVRIKNCALTFSTGMEVGDGSEIRVKIELSPPANDIRIVMLSWIQVMPLPSV